ncbi:MAG TPA: DUF488 domain-containing protein [Nitrospirota bacterium]|nr:DUF488 domain-containing protein [Nitrospirota bacterium]
MIARENDPTRNTKPVIYTIGHSTRPEEEFLAILKAHVIGLVADVRSIPKSRHNPQFNSEAMAISLPEHGIAYEHISKLGGLRHPTRDSPNMGWENASFRGFADYMQTADFEEGLQVLIALAQKKKTAIMCAEAVPWRCHRSLIGDALLVRGITVIDIMSASSFKVHTLTPWAKVMGTIITYPKN